MNRLSKRLGFLAVGLIVPFSMGLAVVSGLPEQAAHAQTAAANNTPKTSQFCSQLPSLISRVNSQLTSLQGKLTTAWSQRDQAITANDTKWQDALTANRAKYAADRQTQYTDLQNKATTDAQKAAVQAFINTVNTAIQTRQTANDQARATFRTAVHNLIASQRSGVSTQLTAFITAVDAAENTATASCSANSSEGQTIRATFQSAMKAAREAYSSDRKGDNGIGDQVKALAATRDAAIKASDAAFVKTAQAAAATLKAAFAGSSTNVSG